MSGSSSSSSSGSSNSSSNSSGSGISMFGSSSSGLSMVSSSSSNDISMFGSSSSGISMFGSSSISRSSNSSSGGISMFGSSSSSSGIIRFGSSSSSGSGVNMSGNSSSSGISMFGSNSSSYMGGSSITRFGSSSGSGMFGSRNSMSFAQPFTSSSSGSGPFTFFGVVPHFHSSTLTNKQPGQTNTGNTNQLTLTSENVEEPNSLKVGTEKKDPVIEESICLKVAIEKKKNRVVFLECSNDFVDIIFSFLTLPIGRILSILQGKSPDVIIGCMNNLYESVAQLDFKKFNRKACKEMLLQPGISLGSIRRKLKLKFDEALDANECQSTTSSEQSECLAECGACEDQGVFVKGESQLFMITDDLQVLAGSTSLSLALLKNLGITDPNELEIQDVVVKHDKLVQLLGLSFVSKSPLTHWILSEKDNPDLTKADDDITSTETFDIHPETNGSKIMKLVLYITKSQNSVLYAECGADFVNCISSFLGFPLGSILKILDCNSQIRGLDRLYASVSDLASNGHLKSEETRNLLLYPKLAPFYGSGNLLLHIEELYHPHNKAACDILKDESFTLSGTNKRKYTDMNAPSVANQKSPTGLNEKRGTYLKGHAKFMVTDDLRITLLSLTGGITYLANSNIPITDVDEVSIEFGVKEVKALLKAALTSKTALTDVFRVKHQPDEGERLLQ